MLQEDQPYYELWKALSEKEQRVVAEYLVDGNAAKAARKAGDSSHCAKEIGSEWTPDSPQPV